MKNYLLKIVLAAHFVLAVSHSEARYIHVPSEYPTIQTGIDATEDGDTVIVSDGTYTGDGNRDIEFRGKAITLMSVNGANNCIIDCQASPQELHRGFYFRNDEDESSVLQGFTIQNGYTDRIGGGGILCESSPLISNCVIKNCTSIGDSGNGAGIHCTEYSRAVIQFCSLLENSADNSGGGIYSGLHSSTDIYSCIVSGNRSKFAGGVYYGMGATIQITDCVISENTSLEGGGGLGVSTEIDGTISNCIFRKNNAQNGGGLLLYNSSVTIVNCAISDNHASSFGGGIYFLVYSYTDVTNCTFFSNSAYRGGGIACETLCNLTAKNSIFFDNTAESGEEIWVGDQGNPSTFTIHHSLVHGDTSTYYVDPECSLILGNGLINAEPEFVNGSYGFFYLSQESAGQTVNSPCLNAGYDRSDSICFSCRFYEICLSDLTTHTDEMLDSGIVDIGFHYSPIFFSTPVPTSTPTPNPTATPQPTQTPIINLGITIEMPRLLHPGDSFWVTGKLINSMTPIDSVNVFFILQIYDSYWFWPSWSHLNHNDINSIDYMIRDLPSGTTEIEVIPITEWIDTGTDRVHDLWFHGAMLNREMTEVLGHWDIVNWGYGP